MFSYKVLSVTIYFIKNKNQGDDFMNSFIKFLEDKVMPIAAKIAAQRHIRALRDGLAVTMPLIIAGSIFMILANLPVPGYSDFMKSVFGENIIAQLTYPIRATFDIVTIVAIVSVSYQLSQNYLKYNVDGMSAGIISLSAFLLLVPVETINVVLENGEKLNLGRVWQTINFSASGLLVGIITSIVATEIYTLIIKKDIVIKMPDSVPPAVAKSFSSIIPAIIILTIFLMIRLAFEASTFKTAINFINVVVGAPLAVVGLSYGGMVGTIFAYHLFWSMGIHGTRVVFGIMDSILLPAMDQNRQAFESGQVVPNIVTKQFHDIFVNGLGGCGATLGLVIAILIVAKSKQLRSVGKLAVGPAIFNISEPTIFGLPIVLNPILIIPFVIAPMIVGSLTYMSMYFGLVSYPIGVAVPWTTPIGISGILATGDFRSVILQLLNVVVATLVYFPFVKVYDKKLQSQESDNDLDDSDDELSRLLAE